MARLELMDTVELMGSSDYRDRFVAEYIQLKIRRDKLKLLITKIVAAGKTADDVCPMQMPEYDCPLSLLRDQLRQMDALLETLEIRAVIEDIDLEDTMMYFQDKKVMSSLGQHSAPSSAEESLKDPEIEELDISLEDCEDDWDVVSEAVGRVLEKGLFNDEDEEKLMAAAVNVLYRIKKFEESSVKTKERHCDKCVHLPICEYCSVHLKGFALPDNETCDMYLRAKESK